MKKLVFILAFIGALQVQAQVPRKVVVEHFTNTYCSICASRNPGFYTNVNQHPDIVHLSYHPSSPYQQCPLNQHNKAENDARTQYYGIFGSTPRLVVQGSAISPGANYNSSALFDPFEGQTSSFSLSSELRFSSGNYNLDITLKRVAAGGPDSATLFAALYEDTVFMTSANGELNPKNVFRRSFAGANGFPSGVFALPEQVGDSLSFQLSLANQATWQEGHLFAAVLLQNPSTKGIEQSSVSAPAEVPLSARQVEQAPISLYPNPWSEGKLYLSGLKEETDFSLYTLEGKLLQSGKTRDGALELAKMPAGLYVLRMQEKSVKLMVKIE